MLKRTKYLEQIRPFIGKPLIKVIVGIRRSGKSTLLRQLIEEFESKGVVGDQIIYINKELFDFDFIRNYSDLHQYVTSKVKDRNKVTYLLIDEIQEIDAWEKAVNSLLAMKNFDIYITGSNAGLLSSELASLLSGRYITTRMFTLSFGEFNELSNITPAPGMVDPFMTYLKYGGFPGIHALEPDENVIRQYLDALYHTILLKDVVMRYQIRDAGLLNSIAHYLIDNLGNITTAKNLSDFMKSQFRRLAVETVQNYLHYMMNAYLFEQVRRYDIKGKRILETHEKYYLHDTGFRLATLGYTPDAISGLLENAVLRQLLFDGYQVQIGKTKDYEIDFIATRNNEKIYLQVCSSLNDPKVVDREYRSLERLNDHFPKFVLSLDSGFETNRQGIRWMNVVDFLSNGPKTIH